MDWNALVLSAKLSLCTTMILLVVGLPTAYWLAFFRRRWKIVVEVVVALPLVLPPTVLGFYILVAIGPRSPLGSLYQSWFGALLPFSFQGLLLASVLYSLPFAVQPFTAAFAGVDRRLLEAAESLGHSRFSIFARIIIPLSMPGLITGVVLSFAHTLGEFGVALMVGGNIPGETRTLSISIYDHVQALDYGAAANTSLVLLAFSFVVLCITYTLGRNYLYSWQTR